MRRWAQPPWRVEVTEKLGPARQSDHGSHARGMSDAPAPAPEAPGASASGSHTTASANPVPTTSDSGPPDFDVTEEAVSKYMDELTARLLGPSELAAPPPPAAVDVPPPPPAEPARVDPDPEIDSSVAASLNSFMASLKEQLAPDVWQTDAPMRRRIHAYTPAEHRARVAQVVREYLAGAALMTTVRCLHASVAQKSYGSEKRFLCPPPVVEVRGTLRGSEAPQLLMQVHGEDGDSVSGEQTATLDESARARFTELHVTGTGKAKSFRLHLHILAPRDAGEPTKRLRLSTGDAVPTRGTSWARFDSAPIGIISKPSKRIAKARNVLAHITRNASVSLFNRINSQTYRTKYLCAQNGRLSAQSRSWSAFRLVILARPGATASHDAADGVLSYGSVIVLVDTESGVATDPLVVCKVDRGRIIPPVDEAASIPDDGEELSAFGAVTQMQKVALMRYVRGGSSAAPPAPRTYLCAGTADPAMRGDADDAHSLPLSYAAATPTAWIGHVPIDEAEDAFCWTLVGISHFAYSFIDVDALGVPDASAGLSLTPFPIVTTMPFYDAQTHKLAMTVQNFYYVRDDAALQMPEDALAAPHAGRAPLETFEVWVGPLGPLPLVAVPVPDSDEAEMAVELPRLRELFSVHTDAKSLQCTLPVLFVRGHDSAIYHSGRELLCQDLVAVVRAAGDHGAANALQKLNVGLGERAGAHELPAGSVWTIRVL